MTYVRVIVDEPEPPKQPRVINVGTAEKPNYAGPAWDVGVMRGIQMALEAVKNCNPAPGYEYDDCVAAIEDLLK